MTAADVVSLYTELEGLQVTIWVDGGWGVDALLGEQTRSHKDLDIAVRQHDIPSLRAVLQKRGYRDLGLAEAKPWNFVMGDESGRAVDIHVFAFDRQGNGMYGPPESGEMYPAESLTGTGTINGLSVRCISPEWAVRFHGGYELTQKDFRDVSALCKKFSMELPTSFASFKDRE